MVGRAFGVGLFGFAFSLVACGDDGGTQGGGGSGGNPTSTTSSSPMTTSGPGSTTTSTGTATSTTTTTGGTTSGTTTGSTSGTTTGSTSNTASSTTGGGMCALPDTTAPSTCDEACSDLYDCSVLTCNGQQVCGGPTGDPAEKANFVAFCSQGCQSQMVLISFIDPASCDTTVQTVQGLSPEFDAFCTMGASTSSSTSSSSASSSSSTGGGNMCQLPDTTAPATCVEACSDLYDCGALTCNGQQNCSNFDGTPMNKATFTSVCEPQCNSQMALISLVDPSSCDTTIQTFTSLSMQFAQACGP
jgi:hypothetical protein